MGSYAWTILGAMLVLFVIVDRVGFGVLAAYSLTPHEVGFAALFCFGVAQILERLD